MATPSVPAPSTQRDPRSVFGAIAERITVWILRHVGRLDAFNEFYAATQGGQYLTPDTYARAVGISVAEAERRIAAAVENHVLRQAYIYFGEDLPTPVELEPDQLGVSIRARDLGFEELGSRLVTLSPHRAQKVYVAAGQ